MRFAPNGTWLGSDPLEAKTSYGVPLPGVNLRYAATPDTNVDLMIGIGGTPEGVLAACALKCLGGAFYGKLYPRNDDERRRALDAGYDLDKVLTLDDMVRSNNVFVAATGVTDGELLHGVRFSPDRATTHSLSMRSLSGAVRLIETRHRISTSNLVQR